MAINHKVLLLQADKYKKYSPISSSWQDLPITHPATEQDYIDNGMSLTEFSTLPDVAYKQLDDDSMEVLYYTDDPDKTGAELEITANYSPLDELEGDFEVVTWTDEESAVTGDRILNMNAIPKPHLIKQVNPINMQSEISNFTINNANNPSKMFLLSNDKNTWKTWNGASFTTVSVVDESTIPNNAMTSSELATLTKEQWRTWGSDKLYLGIYLDEGQSVDNISYAEVSPKETTQIADARLYILNTVSTINVSFAGATLTGIVDDEDKGKVQYRVLLNGSKYYPADGGFTPLAPSPLDIDLTLSNKDYLIDQQNTIRVEFKDYWGTVDYWETTFVGSYSGILFTDVNGDYYSTDVGEVLKHLDFGVIIAGQTTTEQEIRLKNTYGYPIKNVKLYTKADAFPQGMKAQFGSNLTSFEGTEELHLSEGLADGEETSFYIRLSTKLGVTPKATGDFDIVVVADRER